MVSSVIITFAVLFIQASLQSPCQQAPPQQCNTNPSISFQNDMRLVQVQSNNPNVQNSPPNQSPQNIITSQPSLSAQIISQPSSQGVSQTFNETPFIQPVNSQQSLSGQIISQPSYQVVSQPVNQSPFIQPLNSQPSLSTQIISQPYSYQGVPEYSFNEPLFIQPLNSQPQIAQSLAQPSASLNTPCIATTIIDNSVSNSLANALQLLIVSDLIESTLKGRDFAVTEEPFLELDDNPYLSNDAYNSYIPVEVSGSLGGCQEYGRAAEVLLPTEIPAQLICNFGYVPSTVPVMSVAVEPLPGGFGSYSCKNSGGSQVYY